MGRKEFESSDESRPATLQTPEELLLAQVLRAQIDTLLGECDSRSFNFAGKRPARAGDHAREVELFESDKWRTPGGRTANLSRKGDDCYTVEVGDMRLTLNGTYSRVDLLVLNENIFPYKTIAVPAIHGSLRPRIERLKFGVFLMDRITQADSSDRDVFLQ